MYLRFESRDGKEMNGEHIRIRGIVQGVGFRFTVEQVARAHGLAGWVRNDGDDVLVALVGGSAGHEAFLRSLMASLPPRARVDDVERAPADVTATDSFHVAATRR